MASASAPAVELPTFKGRPGWEFTDISGLDLAAYERVRRRDGTAGAEPLWALPDAAELPDGVIVGTLDAPEHRELIERHLGSLVSAGDDVFVALNDAGVRASAFVYVPRGRGR